MTILEGPDIGRTLVLGLGKTLIGRYPIKMAQEEQCQSWTLIDKTVSRVHAEITLADPGVPILKHLSSTNDTYIDGRKIEQENLQDGQVVQMGQTVMLMEVLLRTGDLKEH